MQPKILKCNPKPLNADPPLHLRILGLHLRISHVLFGVAKLFFAGLALKST